LKIFEIYIQSLYYISKNKKYIVKFFLNFLNLNLFFIVIVFFFSSCSKENLYVQQTFVNKASLASSVVETPDPRQVSFKDGQKIIVSWDFPISTFRKNLTMFLTVRYWDNTQDVFIKPIFKKRGFYDVFFEQDKSSKSMQSKKILTYKVDVVLSDDNSKIIETWKHQFWKELINLD
jgi:hypothetical protein